MEEKDRGVAFPQVTGAELNELLQLSAAMD
jgi:hypothetical protein